MRDLVSVVIPTYHRNERLAEAIESVHAQTHDPVEVLVVDGTEDERARPVAEEYGVRYLPQTAAGGAQAARSQGAEAADGAYVNFLDDDDRFDPEKLERQLDVFATASEGDGPAGHGDSAADEGGVGVVYCGARWETGHVIRPDPAIRGDVLEYALRFQMTPSSPSAMLVDGDVLASILPLSNRHGADDMGTKIELARRTRFDFVDAPLLTKGDSEDSLGGSWANVEGRFDLLERYADLYDQYPTARRVALGHTHLLSADLRLDQEVWSARAVLDAARACYHVPGLPVAFLGYLGASLFGRPGRNLGRRAYNRFVLGDEHRGKVT